MISLIDLKNKASGILKTAVIGERKIYEIQTASFDYCQLELEYIYKKCGNINNAIHSETVKLVDEKNNKYDPNAIAIYVFNVKIGYVPADQTSVIRGLKNIELTSVRVYFFNEKYRAELRLNYRSK